MLSASSSLSVGCAKTSGPGDPSKMSGVLGNEGAVPTLAVDNAADDEQKNKRHDC